MSPSLQKSLPRLFGALLLALLALAVWQWRDGPPVQASMLALLPKGAGDALVQQAEQRMQEPLSRELLILIGHPQRRHPIAGLGRQAGGAHRLHLFAAAPEQIGVATLEPHDLPALLSMLDEQQVGLLLGHVLSARHLAHRDLLGARVLVHDVLRRETVVEDDVGLLHCLQPGDGDEPGVAGTASHQGDGAGNEICAVFHGSSPQDVCWSGATGRSKSLGLA